MPTLLIAASGTGGHLFPALAVAQALPADWQVEWLGVPDRMERQLVPETYPLHTVRAGGLQGQGLRQIWNLAQLLNATRVARALIRRRRMAAVFSSGGYIAAPAILAARWCGVPVVLHESNAIPGKVTRLLGRFCTHVAVGLPQASERLSAWLGRDIYVKRDDTTPLAMGGNKLRKLEYLAADAIAQIAAQMKPPMQVAGTPPPPAITSRASFISTSRSR